MAPSDAVPASPQPPAAPAAAARVSPSAKSGKTKANRRLKWTNAMVAELLRLRFHDDQVKRRLEAADTNVKKALAWQLFANVLSQSLGMVIQQEQVKSEWLHQMQLTTSIFLLLRGVQVSSKYRKLECVYRKERREITQTGNNPREREIDEELWTILHDAFSPHEAISGEVLFDSQLEENEEDATPAENTEASPAKSKQPIVQLASAMQSGLEAIAASMGPAASSSEAVEELAQAVKQQTALLQLQLEENQRIMQMQLAIMQQLANQ
ncbi:hypothetical protein PF003_g35507 [Phytophthora fragariae]|nr:hypothetical protein PF003_g35487 [Phytophthora fragariae]KAE8880452.1 hypothetical protein PF003_g35507 [Phytophthora fragariae]